MTEPKDLRPFEPLSLEALFALELPKREYAVDGILPEGSACLLSGREKSGKGLITLDLCASIALAEPFLGQTVRQGAAIYCAAEEHIGDIRDRVAARIGNCRDAPLRILPLDGSTGDRLRLDDPGSMQRLWNMVVALKPVVVVLDPMRELHDRQEDVADEMAPLLRPVRQIAHHSNTAVVVNHHQNRSGTFRGSTAIRAAFDLEWEFTRTDQDSDRDNELPRGRIRVEGRHAPKQIIHMRLGDGLRWIVEHPAATPPEPGTRQRVLEFLAESGWGQTAVEIATGIGVPQRTVQNLLTEMGRQTPAPLAVHGTGTRRDPRRYVVAPERDGHEQEETE